MLQTSALSQIVIATFEEAAAVLNPPPKLKVSEWAEANRVLSSETSSYRGPYRCWLAPYQRDMMDAVNIPGVEEIVFFTGAQLGKSTVEENIAGYFIDQDPGPMGWAWPSLQVAQAWANDTLDPFLRDTKVLAEKVALGSRKSANRQLVKRFPGGILSVIGVNSPVELRRRKFRVFIGDELDGWNMDLQEEGNVLDVIGERMVTFWDGLRVLASTCTVKGSSAIVAAYEATNRQKYFVRCLGCGEEQKIQWQHIKAPRNEEPTIENTEWGCPICGQCHSEADKLKLIDSSNARWIAERPEITKRSGFWLPSYYSPFEPWYKQVAQFREAVHDKSSDSKLKTFTQLKLAEPWEERVVELNASGLLERCEEEWPGVKFQAPAGVCVITCGVDVQPDRLEYQIVGWGREFESWSLAWGRIEGETAKPDVWRKLDELLETKYAHARGVVLPIACTFVDCGYNQGEVMNYTKTRWRRRIWASKGMSSFTAVPLGKRNQNNKQRVWMYPVGSSAIKKTIYHRLQIEAPGPGYMHYSKSVHDADFFDQLTCEKLKPHNVNGRVELRWEKPPLARNEALDLTVYAYAALLSLWDVPEKGLVREYQRIHEESRKLIESGKHNPNQLSLLDSIAERLEEIGKPEVSEQLRARADELREQEQRTRDAAAQAPETYAKDVTPAQAAQPDPPPHAPKPPRRRLVIRRGNW